jgi:hypothetical protein
MPAEQKFLPTVIRLVVVLGPLLVALLFWVSYRYDISSAPPPAKAVTAASISSSISQATTHIDFSGPEGLSNAQSAIMFSIAPLASLSEMTPPVDHDPVAAFRQLIALPPSAAREAPYIDPRRMRTILDRGVVGYASAKSDGDRARAAGLIQTTALLGFSPARDLLARNYPKSEALRSVVPAEDVIRYAIGPVIDEVATSDSEQIFLMLGQFFAFEGRQDFLAAQILSSLRGDSRPQLGYRINTLLDMLTHVPGACGALADLIPGAGEATDQRCSLSENLRKYVETTAPSPAEEESRHRGLSMLNQIGGR